MHQIRIREDFRRDGLMLNFLVDESLINLMNYKFIDKLNKKDEK